MFHKHNFVRGKWRLHVVRARENALLIIAKRFWIGLDKFGVI